MAQFASRELSTLRLEAEAAIKQKADVDAKLKTITEQIATLEGQQETLSLAVVLEEAGAKERYDELEAEIQKRSEQLRVLQSAQKIAQEKVTRTGRARRAQEQVERIKKCKELLAKRDAAGAKVAEIVGMLHSEFLRML